MFYKIANFCFGFAKAAAFTVIGVLALFVIGSYVARAVPSQFEGSIVSVLSNDERSGGTGWSTLSSSGKRVIVTNDHVCQVTDTGYVRILQDNGKRSIKKILRRSFNRDLCVIEGVDAPALHLGSKGPNRFDTLRVMGHPLLKPTAPVTGVYTGDGIAPIGFAPDALGKCPSGAELVDSAFGSFCILHMELSFTTVPIYPGNSGSPVVNQDGEVIGVMNSASSQDNAGMFIPLPYVKEILED